MAVADEFRHARGGVSVLGEEFLDPFIARTHVTAPAAVPRTPTTATYQRKRRGAFWAGPHAPPGR